MKTMLALTLLLASCSTLPQSNRVLALSGESSRLESFHSADELGVRVTYTEATVDTIVPEVSIAYHDLEGSFEGTPLTGHRIEGTLGVRYAVDVWGMRPYLGVGLTAQTLRVESDANEVRKDDGVGVYGLAGVDVPLGSDWSLGLGYRHSGGISLDGENLDAGTWALSLGWSF